MNEDIAERIAAGAPESVREAFLRTVVPGLGQAVEQVRSNPARIRRCNVRQARRVVSLINDPRTLAGIAEHERRVSVREAIRRNPAWQRTPHETICTHCAVSETLPLDDLEHITATVGPREKRLAVTGTSETCDEKIMRTIHLLDAAVQPELWQLAFHHTLSHSAPAYVELAAGRIPVDRTDVPAWGGRNQPRMRRLLEAEPCSTPALLDLAVTAGAVPAHWEVTVDEWERVLREHDVTALTGQHRIPIAAIEQVWARLSARARILALGHATTTGELETLLDGLEADDIEEAHRRETFARGIIDVLHRFPDLGSPRRLGLVTMLPRREIGEYLLGRLGFVPEIDQIDDILALYNLGQQQPSHRMLVEMAGKNETIGENRALRQALITALVRNAKPSDLFSGENRVSEAAHAYTWEHLRSEPAVSAFAGLLEEWTGTLPDLVETAQELGL
jgi:hypothetical protein